MKKALLCFLLVLAVVRASAQVVLTGAVTLGASFTNFDVPGTIKVRFATSAGMHGQVFVFNSPGYESVVLGGGSFIQDVVLFPVDPNTNAAIGYYWMEAQTDLGQWEHISAMQDINSGQGGWYAVNGGVYQSQLSAPNINVSIADLGQLQNSLDSLAVLVDGSRTALFFGVGVCLSLIAANCIRPDRS